MLSANERMIIDYGKVDRWAKYKSEHGPLCISPELERALTITAMGTTLEIEEVYEAMEQAELEKADRLPCDVAWKQNEQEYIEGRLQSAKVWQEKQEGGDNV